MPELPEVETIVTRLHDLVIGKTISSVVVDRPKCFSGNPDELMGQKIINLSRRSKIIRFHLLRKQNILVHLKMTGQLIYVDDHTRVGGGHPTADWIQALPSAYTRVTLTFEDGAQLFFNDQRVFGWMRVMSDQDVQREFAKLGSDANHQDFTLSHFKEKIAHRKLSIKQLIMDNSIVAGVGNIYACDALNLAKIDPWCKAYALSDKQLSTLFDSIRHVIFRGIELKGATIHSFSHIDGFAGKYQDEARVYGRQGMSCYNCGGIVQKKKLAGRGTYFCPQCQA